MNSAMPETTMTANRAPLLSNSGGASLQTTMTYAKNYSEESIRVTHKQVGEHGYLFLYFDYAFVESRYDAATGKYKEQYRPFRNSMGIALEKKYWSKDGLSEQFRKDHGSRRYAEVLSDIEAQKKAVFKAYEALRTELGMKPSPEQIRERLNGKTERTSSRIPLAQYIESLAASRRVRDRRTKLKYRTLATFIRALEACRNENSEFQDMAEGGRGVIYVSVFSIKDWNDLQLMVQEASTDIPRTFRKDKNALGISFSGDPVYAEATLQKLQANLLAALRKAKKDPAIELTIDLDTLEKISAHSTRKVHLHPEEIQQVLEGGFERRRSHLENARKLMLLQIFSGVRVSDLPKILHNEIREVRGRRTSFKAIYLSTMKTGEPICLPLLKPMIELLLGDNKPHMIADANLNLYYKEVARALGLNRIIHTVQRKANSKIIDHQDELHTVVRSHDCRRTFFSMLTGYLYVSRLLASQATGHRLSNAQGEDEGYFQLSPEHKAESLLAQILLAQENLPFDLVPEDFAQQWEASKLSHRRGRGDDRSRA